MPSTETDHSKLTVEEMALRFRAEMVPLGGKFAYFTAMPVAEEDLKQGLLRRQSNVRRETKLFREYAAQSFMDTLTLYLHGICCDIDVETGPRQMPSRYLRKRLQLLHSLFPPPEGYAVFPEDLKVRR